MLGVDVGACWLIEQVYVGIVYLSVYSNVCMSICL